MAISVLCLPVGAARLEGQVGSGCGAERVPPSAAVVEARLSEGYAALRRDEAESAAAALEEALRLDPCRAEAQAQLGYVYTALGRLDSAIEHFRAARELGFPDDRVALQIAYLYARAGRSSEARRWFVRASKSDSSTVAKQAWEELVVRGVAPGTWLTEVYAAPVYQSRFGSAAFPLLVRSGRIMTAPHALQIYGVVRGGRDARLASTRLAGNLVDRSIFLGAGARVRPFGGSVAAYMEAGPVMGSRPDSAGTALRGAFRAGVYDFRSWGVPRGRPPESVRGPYVELYYDASYYSRYRDNVIAYLQVRPGVRRSTPKGSMAVYVPVLAVADTRGLLFNNLLETGIGARWTPDLTSAPVDLGISAEYLLGRYLRDGGSSARSYGDLRITLVVSAYFAHIDRPRP